MTQPALITVDWGTSSLRAALHDQSGAILDERGGGPGILAVAANGFAATLQQVVQSWHTAHGHLPVILSGMIGSRQGWAEVPYLACPAGGDDLARHLHPLSAKSPAPIHIVPGVSIEPPGGAPDVMRGEETQIVGALDLCRSSDGLFVLPGTHSKWVTVERGQIKHFATFMTGEVFAALRQHTILGRLMPQGDTIDAAALKQGIAAGAADGHPGALLNRIFGTRTLGLFDRLPPSALSSYLSGLLIGAELAAATQGGARQHRFTIVGSAPALADNYRIAADVLGLEATLAPETCAAHGAFVLACKAGLIKGVS